jgi:lipopolysaccharide biosynthesis glycosyltransferase
METPIPLYAGYDLREAVGYSVFCQSLIERASVPVAFIPLHGPMLGKFDGQRDGTNAFIYSRFLIPYLQCYQGWAIFADASDMVMQDDIAKLWALRDESKAVMVVKHDYKTRNYRKYIGTAMEAVNVDYPRKNWSSVILWNCGHAANRILTPDLVKESPGSFLHRFSWLTDEQIGELPQEWNALVGEQDVSLASLLHFTLGIPAIDAYRHCDGARHWFKAYDNATKVPE